MKREAAGEVVRRIELGLQMRRERETDSPIDLVSNVGETCMINGATYWVIADSLPLTSLLRWCLCGGNGEIFTLG